MNSRNPIWSARLAALCAACSVVSSSVLAAPTGNAPLDAALAERLALLADDSTGSDQTPDPFLRQAAAMLDIAREDNPTEIRFARSSASVLLRLGEADRALAALVAIRALDPKDQLAMIQFIDLSANRMESAEGKAGYLRQVIAAQGIAPEVRSHASLALTDLLFQRSEDAAAREALDQALTLNPQNIAALSVRYRLAASAGDAVARAKALGDLIIASPVDGGRLLQGAQECIAAGDYDDAHSFYEFAFTVLANHGQPPAIDDVIDLAGSELLGGSATQIAPLIKQALTAIKDDGRLYALDLLAAQFTGSKADELAPAIATARGVYLAQLAGVSQLLNAPDKKEMPATNPAVPMPNLVADAAKLAAGDPGHLRTAYTVALAEQLWFDLYFRAAPVDDASIAALATLLGNDNDPLVIRMQGWKLLSAGKIDEAKVKLSAVADRDGFAKLGLAAALSAESKPDEAKKAIGELVSARPAGMLSSYVAVAAKLSDVKATQTDAESEIAKLFGTMKRTISDLIQNPRGAYLLTATPVNVSFGNAEPLLARVTLQNNGRVPIAIGPGGYIESRFVIDLATRGDAARAFPSVAVGQWAGAVRLLPQQSVSQVVRLDRGKAYAFLRQYPTPVINVTASVTTNAVNTSTGTQAAPGGQRASIGNVMERKSSPLFVEAFRTKVIDQMSNGTPLERMNAMELACAVLPLLNAQTDNADAKKVADQLNAAVDSQLAKEPVEEVKAWVTVARAGAVGGAKGLADVQALAATEPLAAKIAAMVVARSLPLDQRRALAKSILDAKPTGPLAELAQGVYDQPDPPPPPATQPAAGTPDVARP